ncbi:hepatocyte growth factor receptor-like isoform X2 [Ptychodera flava]
MDVDSTAMATVVNTGNLSVILRSDGRKIQENVITPVAPIYDVYEDEQLFECPTPDTQFRISPDNTHLFVFTNYFSTGQASDEPPQYSTTVTKALMANCSAYTYECSSCLSVSFCGWCAEQDRCTMESGCPNGRWFQADATSFYQQSEGRQIDPSCLYIDLVGDYNVTFSPRSGLRTGSTQLQVNITTEKLLYVFGEVMPFVYIGDDVDCQGAFFTSEGMSYFGNSSGPWTYSIQCSVISPGVPYSAIVSVKVMDFNELGRYTLWFNSTEEFKFVVPTFKSFSPLKGPQAGGTLLEIIGTDLLAGNYQNVVIAGKLCELEMDYSTDERLVCSTPEVVEPTQSLVTINYYDNFSLTSLRRFTYTENPFIEAIFPLRTFVGGGEFQYVTGTNLDSIARPLFIVIAYVNETAIDQFESECRVENSTFMACPSPEILISSLFNGTRSRRSVDDNDNECNEITTTPSGESVDFRIGFVLDNVQEWLPSVIQNHLDAKYTSITVARDPVYYMFGGSGNVFSYNPDGNNYLVIEGERLDCGASIQDITIEIGLAFCRPIISLYRTQLTCTPPSSEPPERSEYSRSHGFPHVLVRVGVGDSRYLIGYIDYEDTKSPIEAWVIAIAVCVIVLVLLAIAVIVYCVVRRMRRLSDGAGGKQEKSRQNEYETAHPSSPDAYQSVSFEGGITYMHLSKGRETLMDKLDEGTRLQIQEISIQSSRLQLSSSEVLGKGQFGRVLLGDLLDNDGKRRSQVAVKTLKKYADIDDVRKFLEEGIMMKDFKHPNVLSLIGVCIDDDDCPMIVLPYMKHGDLKSFIEKPERELTVGKLVTYSLHIAQGMEYLSKLKFVHRDLAARNCMVDESETVKVSDFGLSRDIYEREYYASEDKKAKLPIRWMPVESIKKSIFNVKTDVWSYGVLVWELLTRGELPYASIDNWDIPSYLERGRRLPQPAYAPDDLYEVLLRCWHENPAERPEFESVVGQLRNILERGEKGTADKDNYYLQPVESPYYLSLSDSSK